MHFSWVRSPERHTGTVHKALAGRWLCVPNPSLVLPWHFWFRLFSAVFPVLKSLLLPLSSAALAASSETFATAAASAKPPRWKPCEPSRLSFFLLIPLPNFPKFSVHLSGSVALVIRTRGYFFQYYFTGGISRLCEEINHHFFNPGYCKKERWE